MPIFDISRGLQSVLRKNGLEAHIEQGPDGKLYLAAQGRNYPYNRYEISARDADILSRWLDMGTGSTNKKAYETVRRILKDADMPAYVVAQQAGSPVNMGQYGQKWTPERSGFFPQQRFGALYSSRMMGGIVPTMPGERLASGTIRSFDYRSGYLRPTTGVYWKGQPARHEQEERMPEKVSVSVKPEKPVGAERPAPGSATPYSQIITSEVYFDKEKYLDVLRQHGIDVNEQNKSVTIRSSANKLDYQYFLTDEEMKKLLNPNLPPKGVSLQDRLNVINDNPQFKADFEGCLTQDMLESREIISVGLTAEAKERFEGKFLQYERYEEQQRRLQEAKTMARQEYLEQEGRIRRDNNAISGREIGAIIPGKGWFNGADNGREIVVTEIRVDKVSKCVNSVVMDDGRILNMAELKAEIKALPPEEQGQLKDLYSKVRQLENERTKGEEKFIMSAVINGELKTKEISAKDYEKFLRYNDEHRLKLFDNLFKEVSIQKAASPRQGNTYDVFLTEDGRGFVTREELEIMRSKSVNVDGQELRDLNYKKGFYREGAHGREVNVTDIRVEPDAQKEGHYKMTAVINGNAVTHEISQKQYDKFLAVDDYQRLKLFSKVFDDVDMKIRPEHRKNVGAMILAGMVTVLEAPRIIAEAAMGIPPEPRYAPSVFESHTDRQPLQMKASDLAAASYEAEESQQRQGETVKTGQGLGI